MYNVIIFGIVSFLTDMSIELVYPLIPIYLTTQLGVAPAVIGIIEGFAESLASVLKVFSGYISDKFRSRKPLAIGGYAFSAFGKLLLVLSTSWVWVLLARIADRFGKGVRSAPRDALIAESSEKGKTGKSFGLHKALDNMGAAVGIAAAFFLVLYFKGNFKFIFLISMIPAFLGVFVLFAVKEKKTGSYKAKELKFQWSKLNPRLKMFLIVTLIFTLGNSSNQFLLLRAKNLGWDTATTLLLYLTFTVVSTFIAYPSGKLSDKIGRRAFLVVGYLFYGIVYLGFALVTHRWWLWVLFSAYGVYNGLTDSVEKALVAEIAPADQKATLIGLHAMLVGIGLLPASALAGLLWSTLGPQAPFFFGGVMGITAAVALYFVVAPHKEGDVLTEKSA